MSSKEVRIATRNQDNRALVMDDQWGGREKIFRHPDDSGVSFDHGSIAFFDVTKTL